MKQPNIDEMIVGRTFSWANDINLGGRLMKVTELLVLIVFLALSACAPGTPGTEPMPTPASVETASAGDNLANTAWALVSFRIPDAEIPSVEGSTLTIEFREGEQVVGSGGCNSFGSTYQVQGGQLLLGEITTTLIACEDERIMGQEQAYFEALQSAGAFERTENQLVIWYDEGRRSLYFSPAAAATATPTSETPTTVPTPPSQSPTEELTRIVFAPGGTSAEIDATIDERGLDRYVLQALEGQVITVEITSPNNDVLLTVVGADGMPLKRAEAGPPWWTGRLPATQDYYLHAVSVGPGTPYTLRVWVEHLPAETAERVSFEPGATSAQRSGSLAAGGAKAYVLAASAGHTMTVEATTYQVPASLTIESPNGSVWTGGQLPGEVYNYAQTVTLPETGDYVVTLSTPDGSATTEIDITFTIVSAAPPTPLPQPGPPERVNFAPGATSAQLSGLLPTGVAMQQYVLGARADQTMEVQVTSPDVPVSFTMSSPGGTTWSAQQFDSEVYLFSLAVTLQETGDYLVTLTKPERSPSTTYDIMFTITPPVSAWTRQQFGEAWDLAYPADWTVNAAGANEGAIQLQGRYGDHTYQIDLSYPIGITAQSLEAWVQEQLASLTPEQRAVVAVSDLTVANAPARKVLNLPADGRLSPMHQIYIWRTDQKNPRLITIVQLDGQNFDLTAMESLLDRFIAEVRA